MLFDAINKYIPRLIAVFLAAALCFGFASAVFAMESKTETSKDENLGIPETEITETSKVTSGSCGENLSWSFSGGMLTISGSGAMADYSESIMPPWYEIRNEILRISLPKGLTSVGRYAFYECGKITSVTIPDSVKNIDNYAFAFCGEMQILNFGAGVTEIGDCAFSNCYAIVSLKLPDSLKYIGKKAFGSLETITTITIPSGVTGLGVSAFAHCKNLISATINANISELPEYFFYGCEKLSKVSLPSSLSDIGDYSFYDCENLSTVYYNGENISPEELQEEIGATVSEGSSSGETSGGTIYGNEDGTITVENATVTEGEDSTVSTITETILSPEGEIIDNSEAEVTVTITDEKGWEEISGKIEDILDEYGTADDGSERHVNVELYLQGTESIDPKFIESIAGKDVTVTITTENGSVWVINGKDIDTAQLSGNYSLAYVLEAGSAELCEKLGASTCFVLRFLAPTEINAEVMIRIGGSYARRNATLFQDGKEVKKVQSVVVDSDGYAHFYLGSVTEETEYYIGMDVAGAAEEAIIPQKMLEEYGNPEYIEPIKYEITGRSSSWGMNLGQVMSILAVVMVSVIIVVGAVMYFWNKQRLKNGYVPNFDEEET